MRYSAVIMGDFNYLHINWLNSHSVHAKEIRFLGRVTISTILTCVGRSLELAMGQGAICPLIPE